MAKSRRTSLGCPPLIRMAADALPFGTLGKIISVPTIISQRHRRAHMSTPYCALSIVGEIILFTTNPHYIIRMACGVPTLGHMHHRCRYYSAWPLPSGTLGKIISVTTVLFIIGVAHTFVPYCALHNMGKIILVPINTLYVICMGCGALPYCAHICHSKGTVQ